MDVEGVVALTAPLLAVVSIALSAWGWLRLPPDTRFRAYLGSPPSLDATVPKAVALVVWPLMVGGLAAVIARLHYPTMELFGVVVAVIVVATQAFQIGRASRSI